MCLIHLAPYHSSIHNKWICLLKYTQQQRKHALVHAVDGVTGHTFSNVPLQLNNLTLLHVRHA